ncbi:MAG: hypothetical protein A2513_10140 [Sulfurimonas sp. RIFOXYD12_FULL_33_39]|uniref:hypothetical protein n=1 Tax=unclassified Sulfurimonas TaxID=2623549 RepID=UPI0008AD5175|nr:MULTISPECIES: hypothetical protein [unclassified Sulfurimonas]OHE09672.1 MAG: hypothetical protein A2513_10140 [Sulfurimonas sp. RIFOXYD12_FULL_33_39]OHE13820.1 MAG: hypothetical protein A2530_09615 [Sulfurimonas sp. RIFOXYD2_FULL_34_21]
MKITNSMLLDKNKLTLELYYDIFLEIEHNIPENGNYIINIDFDNSEEIFFIHPLFLVYLLNLYEKLQINEKYFSRDIRIILNIEKLNKKVQSYIQTYLTQYIDCGIVLIVDNTFRDRNKPPTTLTDKKILLYTTEKENNLTLLRKQKYNFLPIIKIANNTFNEVFEDKDYWTTNKATGKSEKIASFGNRKVFYKSLQLETIEKGAYKNKSEKVWTDIFEIYLELTQNGAYITEKFKEIFREIVENIQKHTKIDDIPANGYISFYINRSQNLYELIVSDDYQKGFLSKYLETIIQEKEDEPNELIKKEYQKIIDDLDNKNYEKVLNNIFDLNYVLSTQKERMTKHFGLPLLLKIVNQLEKLSNEKNKNDTYVNLKIYLNKDEQSFLVTYKNAKATVARLKDYVVHGTYFHLSFPQNLHLDNPAIITQQPLKLTSKYYRELLEDKEKPLEKHLENFKYYFDLKDRSGLSDKINAVIVDYAKIEETSNFLRDLYSFAFLNSVQDILVVNYPIEENIEYLKILSETTDVSKICNIAFLNKEYPQVLFLGGANHQEMCGINTMLSQTYNYNKRNFLETCQGQNGVNLTSNLFYTNHQNKQMFFPFELFLPNPRNQNELLYTLMLDNFLEIKENYEDIHLDLQDDFHIKKFYYLKYVFENSQWVKLMSFDLAKKIKNKSKNFENIIFVGIEKYSSSFIAELEYLLDVELQSYIISDLNSKQILEQFNKFKKLHNNKRFVFIRPSVFESDIDKNLAKDLKNYEKYTLIQLTKDGTDSHNWIASYSKNLNDVLQSASKCSWCFDENKPLYEIDKDKYNIKDLYHTHDTYKKNDNIFQVSWKDTIYFPHIERNTNHYLYYIRTTQFFKNNKDDIKEYFKNIEFKRDEKVPVILTSAHNTNAEFVALINEIVFENDAIIHSLSLNNKEQGYFSINNLTSTYKNKEDYYSFYFVDDAISSGEAFKYIYSVLSSFFADKFQAVFTLIDRTNEKDFSLMDNFYKDKHFYRYLKINIHPIKTGFEDCYLCERKKIFEKIAISSSLVTIKHTFQKKAKDLAMKSACSIEYELLESIADLKNYLRMSSTEYIYQYIDEFERLENIEKKLDNYYDDIVKNYFEKNYLNGKSLTYEIDKFLKVESKIAFLKSLAFPKVYFFKTLRKNIHKYIYEEIRKFTNLSKDNIKVHSLLTDLDYVELDKCNSIKEIVLHYKDKNRTNLDYFSFLLSLGSFLGVNHILSYEVIMYYYKITDAIKSPEKYEKYKRLLNMYPIAVKQLTTYSEEKSKYFERELEKFYGDIPFKYTRTFSRIFGLFVENTTHLNIDKNIFQTIVKERPIDEKIQNFKAILEKIISKEVKSICIDLNENIDNCLLIDVLNKYKELDKGGNEEVLYRSAFVKKEIDDNEITIEYRKENDDNKKYNIWCNFYQDFRTYIRITNNDKLIPIGVIVIEHTKMDEDKSPKLNEHLLISRWILAYQNIICKLFQDYNMISAMRSKYEELIELKRIAKEKELIEKIISNINHSTFKQIRIYTRLDNLIQEYNRGYLEQTTLMKKINEIKDFSIIIEYVASLGKYYDKNLKVEQEQAYCIENVFFNNSEKNDFYQKLISFLNITDMNPLIKSNDIKLNVNNNIYNFPNITIKRDIMNLVFFEFILNALKYGKSNSHINIYSENRIIIIENEKNTENEDTSESYGVGHTAIKNILETNQITMDIVNDDPMYYKIHISKENI